MTQKPILLNALGISLLCLSLGFAFSFDADRPASMGAQLLNFCVGKPYGYPGCPVKKQTSSGVLTTNAVPPNCGDSILNSDEECDLGRFNGLTNCTKSCKLLYCGDGLVSAFIGEQCEPAVQEMYALDPVTKTLVTEVQFVEKSCGSFCSPPVCNDDGTCLGGCELLFLGECPVEPVATFAAPMPAASPAQLTVSNQAASVPSFQQVSSSLHAAAPTQPPSSSPAAPICGNGIREASEECDDGNQNNFDNCPNNCKIANCGDNVREGREECDDGNNNNYDECPNDCRLAVCGDGVKEGTEQCDDGNFNDRDDCPNNCRIADCGNGIREGKEECDDGNQNNFDDCPNDCRMPVCGDGIREGKEKCDDGNQNNFDDCPNDCRLSVCGDGIKEGTEECDDGNKSNFDDCPNDCRLQVCGDGVKEGREQCDDGNQNNFDECPNNCRLAFCGDGNVEGREQCDDGNRMNFDACPNDCQFAVCGDGVREGEEECDDGNKSNFDECPNDCRLAVCGDSIREGKEECDDGNANDFDDCPNYCRLPVCGNGIKEAREQCDDGNTISGDGCSASCIKETVCGNSILEIGEQCDSGGQNSDEVPDVCRLDCHLPYCGDGVTDAFEDCDGGDRCTVQCTRIPFTQTTPGVIAIVGGGLLALLSTLAYVFRTQIKGLFKKGTVGPVSLDDIPLDELEMPWHKWEDNG